MQVNWTKSALRDLEIEANYLNKINPSIESNFLEHVESSVTLIKKISITWADRKSQSNKRVDS